MFQVLPNGEERASYNCSMLVKAILMPADKCQFRDPLPAYFTALTELSRKPYNRSLS